jgi:hypothetical protein
MQSSPRTWAFVRSATWGFFLAALLVIAALLLRWILHIDPVLLTFLTLAVAYGLYATRTLRPFTYGTTELVIGMFAVFFTAQKGPEVFQDQTAFWASFVLPLSAGIYIAVRGLDNMARSPLVKGNDRALWIFECRWWRKWKE